MPMILYKSSEVSMIHKHRQLNDTFNCVAIMLNAKWHKQNKNKKPAEEKIRKYAENEWKMTEMPTIIMFESFYPIHHDNASFVQCESTTIAHKVSSFVSK